MRRTAEIRVRVYPNIGRYAEHEPRNGRQLGKILCLRSERYRVKTAMYLVEYRTKLSILNTKFRFHNFGVGHDIFN